MKIDNTIAFCTKKSRRSLAAFWEAKRYYLFYLFVRMNRARKINGILLCDLRELLYWLHHGLNLGILLCDLRVQKKLFRAVFDFHCGVLSTRAGWVSYWYLGLYWAVRHATKRLRIYFRDKLSFKTFKINTLLRSHIFWRNNTTFNNLITKVYLKSGNLLFWD